MKTNFKKLLFSLVAILLNIVVSYSIDYIFKYKKCSITSIYIKQLCNNLWSYTIYDI